MHDHLTFIVGVMREAVFPQRLTVVFPADLHGDTVQPEPIRRAIVEYTNLEANRAQTADAEQLQMLKRTSRVSGVSRPGQNQFSYVIRGHTAEYCSGLIPRQVFDAEPESVLAHVYSGDWQYDTDEQGRAVVNSNPAHWPLIVDWLSFGTIPESPSPAFISECKYWHLSNLLAALKEAVITADNQHDKASGDSNSAHIISKRGKHSLQVKEKDEGAGLILDIHLNHFVKLISSSQQAAFVFPAYGRDWKLQCRREGVFLDIITGPALHLQSLLFFFGPGPDAPVQLQNLPVSNEHTILTNFKDRGARCKWTQEHLAQVTGPKVINFDGSLCFKSVWTFS